MEKKNIDWAKLGFGYTKTDYRWQSEWKDGAWDQGGLITDEHISLLESACVFHYSQSCFEGLKAYTTKDGHIVTFRPDLNAKRMADSAARLEMPAYPVERFVHAVEEVVRANAAWVPPYGTGCTLYIRPVMIGSGPQIGVAPAPSYLFRVFCMPVGAYFKGAVKPLKVRIAEYDRAAPHGTGHIKAGLNYAMSLYPTMEAHREGYAENITSIRRPARILKKRAAPMCSLLTRTISSLCRRAPRFCRPSRAVRSCMWPNTISDSR